MISQSLKQRLAVLMVSGVQSSLSRFKFRYYLIKAVIDPLIGELLSKPVEAGQGLVDVIALITHSGCSGDSGSGYAKPPDESPSKNEIGFRNTSTRRIGASESAAPLPV